MSQVDLKENAQSAAKMLTTSSTVLLILAGIGGFILVVLGVIPQCPGGGFECSEWDRSALQNPLLVGLGLVSILFWFWVFALSRAIAARLLITAEGLSTRQSSEG